MKLSFKEYYDKLLGCYIGKNIGGTIGAPFECYRGEYNIDWFVQDISRPIPNDDLDLQLVWLRAAELDGNKIDSHILAEYWNTYISATLAEYGTGKNNFNKGIVPPLSGHMRNTNKDSNGAWIRSEIWACLCPGSPALAARYAYYDSSVDHSGEGVYSAVFCAAVQSAAFFESDIYKLIDIGKSYIPADCAIVKAIDCAIACYQSGKTWQQARKALFKVTPSAFGMMGGYWKGVPGMPATEKYPAQEEDPEIPSAPMGYDAPWSIGAIILSLLYGEGDMGKTVCIATNCGEDTDCTAGTAGSIAGIISGAKKIPEKWKNACSNEIATWTLRIDQALRLPKTIGELCYRIARMTPTMLGEFRCKTLPGFTDFDTVPSQECFYEIIAAEPLSYTSKLDPFYFEDVKQLISEQGTTVRRHFGLFNALVKFDEGLVKIEEGGVKRIELEFLNCLFDPQYLSIRIIDFPAEWTIKGGTEFCVGLEHWHGGINRNLYTLEINTEKCTKGRYTLILEISSDGRMMKNYLPITLINGAC